MLTIHVSSLFPIFARHLMMNIFNLSEMGIIILVWLALIAGGVIICAFIGSVIFKVINSRVLTFGLDAVKYLADYFSPATSTKSTVVR